jgi:hypothetical protein
VISSAGRASALQAECRRFDPVITHHFRESCESKMEAFKSLHRRAAVVQSVRIPACHAGGRGFESRPLRHIRSPGTLNARSPQEARSLSGLFCVWDSARRSHLLLAGQAIAYFPGHLSPTRASSRLVGAEKPHSRRKTRHYDHATHTPTPDCARPSSTQTAHGPPRRSGRRS